MRGKNAESKVVLSSLGLEIGYRSKGDRTRRVANLGDLQLNPGEFVCLLGPNGVGKSTLIRTLAGMQSPLHGCIKIADTRLDEMLPVERARAISVVLTERSPVGMFDGYAVVSLGRHPHTGWTGRLSALDKERIDWAIDAVGARSLARRQVSELSDGERQKILIARALAQEAKVMLLDEPTAFLDLPRRVELMRTLRDLARREGLSILLSTHDLDLALRSADKLWLLGESGEFTSGMPEALALGGSLARTFRSSEVDWDEEQGSFRMHHESCARIGLEGSGATAIWTRRALTRIGYEVVETDGEMDFRIRVEQSAQGTRWLMGSGEREIAFSRLEELTAALLNMRHEESGTSL